MHSKVATVVYLLTMVALIVGVDILLLSHNFTWRLITNIGIVLVFILFYLKFLRRP